MQGLYIHAFSATAIVFGVGEVIYTESWGVATQYEERVLTPREMNAFHGSALFTGHSALCGLSASGTLRCAGSSEFLAQGPPPSDLMANPVPSIIPGMDRPASVFVGLRGACALSTERTLRCWGPILGDAQRGAAPRDFPEYGRVSSISLGPAHWCVLRCDGTVACAGSNSFGQLGTEPRGQSPWESQLQTVPASANTRRVVTGSRGNCLLGNNGRVHCWGTNRRGELGDGTTLSRWIPREVLGLEVVTSLDITKQTSVEVGDTVCAVSRGLVYCWGYDFVDNLPAESPLRTRPVRVTGLPENIVQIVMGNAHALALTASGEVYCWGAALQCALVQGDEGFYQRAPIRVPLPPP